MIITGHGKVIRVHAGEIREAGRGTQGVRLLRLDDGDRVAAAASILEEEDEAAAATDTKPEPPKPDKK
jgi:DNA gyrase subunit A